MTNEKMHISRILLRGIIAVLLAFSGLTSCSGGSGSPTSAVPTATLAATPSSIANRATSTITWSSTDSSSCVSSGGGGTDITVAGHAGYSIRSADSHLQTTFVDLGGKVLLLEFGTSSSAAILIRGTLIMI